MIFDVFRTQRDRRRFFGFPFLRREHVEGVLRPWVAAYVLACRTDLVSSDDWCPLRTLRRRAIQGHDGGGCVVAVVSYWTYVEVLRILSNGSGKRRGNAWSIGLAHRRAALSQAKTRVRRYKEPACEGI